MFRHDAETAGETRALPEKNRVPSAFLLHHQNERANERGGEDEPDALQRPDVIGHEHFADPFDGERFDLRRGNRERRSFSESTRASPPNTASATTTPLQLKPRCSFGLAPREQNGENNQDSDGADINKNLHQSDEFSA